MKRLYIITGALGHLGGTIIRQLQARGAEIRGLVLPGEQADMEGVEYISGDVRDLESLRPLFEGATGYETIVIHTAGIVDITGRMTPLLREVNVGGTCSIVRLCMEYGVKRLVHVSSVHAIPEQKGEVTLREVDHFSSDAVVGGYAKTKAEATQCVLDATMQGLDAVVVHPSGILGPNDNGQNHLVQMIRDYLHGRLPACVQGGYDMVDVRDVADGCIRAAEMGRSGECYILSNQYCEIQDILKMARSFAGGRRLPVLPIWLAGVCTPFIQLQARIEKRRPLFTRYSLHTLSCRNRFSHAKATAELGYRPRDLALTIRACCPTV